MNRLLDSLSIGAHVGVVLSSLGCPSLSLGVSLTASAVALVGARTAPVEVGEWAIGAAPLAPSMLDSIEGPVILAVSCVEELVLADGKAAEVGEVVVERVEVVVVDVVSGWDGSVGLLPDPSVGELSPLLAVFLPADVLTSLDDSSPGGRHGSIVVEPKVA
jgi:hypothetical protein